MPWPYAKVIVSVHIIFGCFLIYVLVSLSGVCYLNYATPVTLSRECINQSQVAASTGAMVASVPVTDAQLDIDNGVQLENINKLCCAAYYF